MKKYLTVSTILIVCAVAWIIISNHYFIHIGGDNRAFEDIVVNFVADEEKIYRVTEDGNKEFQIRGVNLDSSLPGHYATDFAVDKETYLRWFALIQEMGANTINVPTIMDEEFYNALYEYNVNNPKPLYLMQSLWVTEYAQDSKEDAYSDDYYKRLMADAKTAVDVIHGEKLLSYSKSRGSGWYQKDISRWVLGIVLGTTWRGETIAYTNHRNGDMSLYQGKYFGAGEDATAFESMLAEILNDMMQYETKKYGEQHLVSIVSEPVTDPFDYEQIIRVQINKYDSIDANHIEIKDTVKSGFFASYKMYEACEDILQYLTDKGKHAILAENSDIELGNLTGQTGYMELLSKYHKVPTVIAGYGYSTSRGMTDKTGEKYGLTEEEQGEALMKMYAECMEAGFCGGVISAWQDSWHNMDWNVYPLIDKEQEPYWHNVESEAQGYGILAFEAGEKASKVIIDGETPEWGNAKLVYENEDGQLFVRYDEAYLYLLIKRETTESREEIYIPIDVTPKSGSTYCQEEKVKFEREADFLLVLDGEQAARIMVQAYYDPWRAAWRQRIEHKDAYTIEALDTNTSEFMPIRMVLDDEPELSGEWHLRNAETVDIGQLTYGITDPESEAYNSRADFYTQNNVTEIRIPWLLLNFYDPSTGRIHDDYYENYGIEGMRIQEIYFGMGSESNKEKRIGFGELKLAPWNNSVDYYERLKKSYQIIQKNWTGQ